MRVFHINISQISLFNVFPIRMVRLSLSRVPLVFIIFQGRVVRRLCVSIVKRAWISSASYLTFFRRRIRCTILSVPIFVNFRAARTSPIRRRVVRVVSLRLLRQVIVRHSENFTTPYIKERIQGLNNSVVFITQVTTRNSPRDVFQASFTVNKQNIRMIRAILSNVIDRPISRLLISFIVTISYTIFNGNQRTRMSVARSKGFIFYKQHHTMYRPIHKGENKTSQA